MFNYSVHRTTITCTPHIKEDAERPWITQEGDGQISVWMHPKSSMTLEEVAKLVENAAVSQAESQAEETQDINLHYQYSATIHNNPQHDYSRTNHF